MCFNLLKGKKGIIFGVLNENSIAWQVAKYAYEEGASIILSNTPIAARIGNIYQLAKQIQAYTLLADATSIIDLEILFDQSIKFFNGKIDFILHSIAMSENIRKNINYTDLDYNFLKKGWDISAVSFHKIMKIAWNKNVINEWGSIVAVTYIASQRVLPNYNDMSDYKAYLESITRNFGYYWGTRNIRVNTVSQSPTFTTASKKINNFNNFFHYADKISPLGNASAEECAKYIITLFSDLTKKVTMQNLYHDGGFSKTIINDNII